MRSLKTRPVKDEVMESVTRELRDQDEKWNSRIERVRQELNVVEDRIKNVMPLLAPKTDMVAMCKKISHLEILLNDLKTAQSESDKALSSIPQTFVSVDQARAFIEGISRKLEESRGHTALFVEDGLQQARLEATEVLQHDRSRCEDLMSRMEKLEAALGRGDDDNVPSDDQPRYFLDAAITEASSRGISISKRKFGRVQAYFYRWRTVGAKEGHVGKLKRGKRECYSLSPDGAREFVQSFLDQESAMS